MLVLPYKSWTECWFAALHNPELYEETRKGELETWNRKYAEVMEALDKAEGLWLAAQERLDLAAA